MYCRNCGTEIEDGCKFCTSCGTAATSSNNGQSNNWGAGANQGYSNPNNNYTNGYYNNQPQQVKENEGELVGWSVLGFFMPLVGFMLFLVWNTSLPKRAHACLKGAAISLIVGVVVGILIAIIMVAIIFSFASELSNDIYYGLVTNIAGLV